MDCYQLPALRTFISTYRMNEEWLKKSWEIACDYFSQYVDDQGVCMVDLDDFIDGNVLDHQKRIAATFRHEASHETA